MKSFLLSLIALLMTGLIFTSCSKQSTQPPVITVNAGSSQTIQLPKDTVTLTGTVTSGQSPNLVYAWTIIVGPNLPNISNGNSTVATVTGLVSGTYIFQFSASNSTSTVIGEDTVSVIVVSPITIYAGPSQTIQLPKDTVTLTGTVVSSPSLNLIYAWSVTAGPNVPTITNSNSLVATATGLIAGTYVFQFTASNGNSTAIGKDTVTVVSLKSNTLTLQPANNPYEGFISSLNPTVFESGDAHQLLVSAWTYSGTFYAIRTYIKFDFSAIPSGATIDNAQITFYPNPVPIDGDKVDAESGSNNSCYIQRITSNWALPTSFSWNNQPSTTITNQAVIPQSTSATQIDNVDVTALVKDMQTNGNNGFSIQLQSEVIYNIKQYASSYNSDPTIHPKLEITYH